MILYLSFLLGAFSGLSVFTGKEEIINSTWSDSCQEKIGSMETGTNVFKLTPIFPLPVSDAVITQRIKFSNANTTTAKGISPAK